MAKPLPQGILPNNAAPLTNPVGMPLVVDARRLADMLSLALRTVRSMDAAGKLPKPIRIGGSVRWPIAEIEDWLAAGAPSREVWEARVSASRKPLH
jgi:predicted DNA-binding transcriptional regulator AlpA